MNRLPSTASEFNHNVVERVCHFLGVALVVGPQGNSFSGPHAAGVAALMLSVNPEMNAWQVKRLMEETCKDLGTPGRDTVFGAGLLQARDAVRAAKRLEK
jgi:subtilisin family serine protease